MTRKPAIAPHLRRWSSVIWRCQTPSSRLASGALSPVFSAPSNRNRPVAGFTLIEMLIVITIIGILAALAFPATTAVISMANGIKCSNNLRQLAIGIGAYSLENDEKSPANVMDLLNAGFGKKSFLCPFDKTKGTNQSMGRRTAWDKYEQIWEKGCSYMYEFSSAVDEVPLSYLNGGAGKKFAPNLVNAFYRNLDFSLDPDNLIDGYSKIILPIEKRNWQDGKRNQQAFGNLAGTPSSQLKPADFGAAFASSEVPIIRCYHHYDWNRPLPAEELNYPRKMNNIFLDMSVGTGIPHWERQANPLIPAN